jgi:acetoin:2,6-dichlorophenolindophenol oxidoreductase subunit beta
MPVETSYCDAIRQGFWHLFKNHKEFFAIGQGLWAPWYVGNSMLDLDKEFGKERLMDCPVSEAACTGVALGASLCGDRPIIIHPRLDFMLLAVDQIVTQAAKWSAMFGGQSSARLTIRAIINRGGEQGAQHSQALHAWFAQVPGLRVVMPAGVQDARDLLVAGVLCDDPVLYIDDRWLYHTTASLPELEEIDLRVQKPRIIRDGADVTLVGAGYSTYLCQMSAAALAKAGVSAEVVDLRVINPLDATTVVESVKKTGRLCVVDGGWRTCGLAGEIIARVSEEGAPMKSPARRIALPDAPAPTSSALEKGYYPTVEMITQTVAGML